MRSPHAKIAVVTVVLAGLTLGLLIYAMMQQAQVTCEVCVTYNGRTLCRTAVGPDRDEAIRTAIGNACGLLAAGMTDTIRCANTPPDSVTCDD